MSSTGTPPSTAGTGNVRTDPADRGVVDVAIVGFGPVGAVLAALLGQAGLSVYACDRLSDVHDIPRAIALDHEIQRIFQQLGVIDAVLPFTEPFTDSVWMGADGGVIRRMTMVPPPYPLGWTPSIVFTQPPVERVLREAVRRLPSVRVALGHALEALQADESGAELTVRGPDGEAHTVRARWVVGCDGGSSTVRGLLGLPLDDLGFDEPWLVVDVLVDPSALQRLPATSVQYCEPDRPCTLVIGPGNHRRWEISLKPGEDPREAATPEGTWRLLSRWLGPQDGRLWRQSSYRFHALVASRWRAGRVFLAGDAAHMQPPFLGQGLCQGVRDAANLAWKLAAVVRGEVQGAAAEALLDSYGAERQQHVRALTTTLKAIGAIICERDPQRARARDERLRAEAGGEIRGTPRQDVLPRLETGCLSSDLRPGRGAVFPQPRLADGILMDRRLGTGWRLVLAPPLPLRGDEPRLRVLALGDPNGQEADGVAAAWLHRHEAVAALIRPDHVVFGTAAVPEDIDGLLEQWRRTLGAS